MPFPPALPQTLRRAPEQFVPGMLVAENGSRLASVERVGPVRVLWWVNWIP